MGILDGQTVDVPCPECGHKNGRKVEDLRRSPTIVCGGCSKSIKIEASGLDRETKKVDKAIDDLKRAFKKF